MAEVTEATTRIYQEVHDEATIILGVIFDDTLGEAMRVTVIATGIKEEEEIEVLPSKVMPLAARKEQQEGEAPVSAPSHPAPGRRVDSVLERREKTIAPPVLRPRTFGAARPQFLDEEELDRPTFIRRNEN